jgi:hypothetical protein
MSEFALSIPLLEYAFTAKYQVADVSPSTTYDLVPGFAIWIVWFIEPWLVP